MISANDGAGVRVTGQASRGTRIVGNYVGTDATGLRADAGPQPRPPFTLGIPYGNRGQGIIVVDAPGTVIGTAGAGNVIAFNGGTVRSYSCASSPECHAREPWEPATRTVSCADRRGCR